MNLFIAAHRPIPDREDSPMKADRLSSFHSEKSRPPAEDEPVPFGEPPPPSQPPEQPPSDHPPLTGATG